MNSLKLFPIFFGLTLSVAGFLTPAWGEEPAPIFRRFGGGSDSMFSKSVQMIGFSGVMAPQTFPDAQVQANDSFLYLSGNPVGFRTIRTSGWEFGRMTWLPKSSNIQKVQTVHLAFLSGTHFKMEGGFVFSSIVGIGVMDGLIRYNTAQVYQTRLEPFIPVRMELGYMVTRSFLLSGGVDVSSYFGPGPVISAHRYVLSMGFGNF